MNFFKTSSEMPKKVITQVKEENEIQSYINSFKEIEEPEGSPSTSKVYIEDTEIGTSEAIGEDGSEEYKYVFIVQDDEDCADGKEAGEDEIYEFEEYGDEEMLNEADDKSKILKSSSKKGAAGNLRLNF